MATGAVFSITTADAGSVAIALPAGAGAPAGGIVVNSSLAGSVNSTGTTGVSTPPSIQSAAVHPSSVATGGCVVTTIGAGAVDIGGPVRNVDTRHAGSVKIGFTAAAQMSMPATGAGGDSTHSPGGASTVAGTGAGGNEQEVSWKVAATAAAAAALDLFDLAHGDKLRAFLVVIAGAAAMHARGAIGRRILYASLAVLLIGIVVHHSAWILDNLESMK